MFILFCVLQGVVQAFAWGVLIWLWLSKLDFPETSSYPIIDFAIRTRFSDSLQNAEDIEGAHGLSRGLDMDASDSSVRKRLKDTRTMLLE